VPAMKDDEALKKLRGPLFILFEGIDGSGKTTQADMLASLLDSMSVPVARLAEPTRGVWGAEIRKMLSGNAAPDPWEQVRLFILDRREDVAMNVIPALGRGDVIVMDRYYYSNAAYQGAGGVDPGEIMERNRKEGFPEPDRIYFIDIDPGLAMNRIASRNNGGATEIFEKGDFLSAVRKNYLSILGKNSVVIDGSGAPEKVFASVVSDIRNAFIQ